MSILKHITTNCLGVTLQYSAILFFVVGEKAYPFLNLTSRETGEGEQ